MKNRLSEYKKNPRLWQEEVLDNYQRWHKQIEIIESVAKNRDTYVKSCHGVGKTFTAKDVCLWFLTCHYPSIVITTAPSWSQVEKLLWAEINTAYNNCKVNLGGKCLKTQLIFDDNWYALGIAPRIENEDDGKRLTGFHSENLLVIFDEAPAVNNKIWEIKETLMTSKNVRFLAIGNPVVNSGPFYEGFFNENVNSITMSIFDSPNFVANNIKTVNDILNISKKDIGEREDIFSKMVSPFPWLTNPRWAVERAIDWGVDSPLFKSRVLSEFPEQSSDTLISLSLLERSKAYSENKRFTQVLGVDVARYGSDDTVFYHYKGNNKVNREKFNGQNIVETANRIKNKILNGVTYVVIDDTGLGGGVTDIINDFITSINGQEKIKLIPVNFAQAAIKEEYEGIITELWFNAKSMLESEEIKAIDEGALYSELVNRKYKYTTKGKFKIESKDEYKKRTGNKSPDEADAFILTAWGIANSIGIYGYSDAILSTDGREEYTW